MLSCRKGQWVCCGERWRLMERDGETPLLTLLQQSLGDCSLLNTNGLWQINTSLPRLPNDIKVNTCNISHNPFPSALPGLDPTAIPIFSRLALTLPILRLALLFTGFPCQPGLRISFLPYWLWTHVFYRLSRVQVKYQSQNVSTDWLFHIHGLPPQPWGCTGHKSEEVSSYVYALHNAVPEDRDSKDSTLRNNSDSIQIGNPKSSNFSTSCFTQFCKCKMNMISSCEIGLLIKYIRCLQSSES